MFQHCPLKHQPFIIRIIHTQKICLPLAFMCLYGHLLFHYSQLYDKNVLSKNSMTMKAVIAHYCYVSFLPSTLYCFREVILKK